MKTQVWKAAVLAAVVATTTGCLFANGDPMDVSKAEAERRMSDDPDSPDYCAANGWYNDGVCDAFCRQPDVDCEGITKECDSSADCSSGQYCETAAGQCGGTGACEAIPDAWTEEYAPVCGCDGVTYGNAGEAAGSGASVDYEGECGGGVCQPEDCGPMPDVAACPNGGGPTITCVTDRGGSGCSWEIGPCETETFCGGFAGETCADDEYCDYGPGGFCGFDDGGGVCRPRPEACGDVWAPVCGCDFVTYGNACEANAAGVGVFEEGECERPNDGCDEACAPGEFCAVEGCGDLDVPGECRPMPQGCPENYDPVCGCDGQTYSNGCFADAAGASVAYEGECADVPGECAEQECGPRPGGLPDMVCADGTTTSLVCAVDDNGVCGWVRTECEDVRSCGGFGATAACGFDEYCHYEPADMCGFTDGLGECRPRPEGCTTEYEPVCGCDGKTYGNACSAHEARTSVSYEGECRD